MALLSLKPAAADPYLFAYRLAYLSSKTGKNLLGQETSNRAAKGRSMPVNSG
jgi:hypothetical protein